MLANFDARNCGQSLKSIEVKKIRENKVSPLLAHNEDLALAGQASKDSVDFLIRQIWAIETGIENRINLQVPLEAINMVFRNNREAGFYTVLSSGDRIAFSAKTGAM